VVIIVLALIPISILLFNIFPTPAAGVETPLRGAIIVRNRLLLLLGIISLFSLTAAIFDTLAQALQERQQDNLHLLAETQKLNQELEQRVVSRTEQLQASNAQLLTSQAELRRLSQQIMDVTEQERTRISREIHDQLGQRLTVIKLEVQMAQRRLTPEQNQTSRRLDKVTELVDGTIQIVRRIAADLRPGILDDFGLSAATEWQLDEFSKRTGIHCQLTTHLDERLLAPDLCTASFRILREGLINVARHAQASKVQVTLQNDADALTLIVQDNGRGITAAQQENPTTLGLLGMRERARQFGGTVTLVGVPGSGTTVTVTLPLPPMQADTPTLENG
jgi:signal transduction histidine kinase